jgi:hypothetical protein
VSSRELTEWQAFTQFEAEQDRQQPGAHTGMTKGL